MDHGICPSPADFSFVSLRDPGEVLGIAGGYLRSDPVRHNYVLSLLQSRVRFPQTETFWVIFLAEKVCGVAFAAPGRPLCLPDMTEAGLSALSAFLGRSGQVLSGVFGGASTAPRFAGLWTEQHDLSADAVDALRLYVHREARGAIRGAGELVQATGEDAGDAVRMTNDYFAEIGETSNDLAGLVKRRIAEGTVLFWREGSKTRAMAGYFPAAAGAARIHMIYTPPEWRGMGYGRDALAALTNRLAGEGLQCMAFAQIGNATSNRMYRDAGYEAAGELLRYRFSLPQREVPRIS